MTGIPVNLSPDLLASLGPLVNSLLPPLPAGSANGTSAAHACSACAHCSAAQAGRQADDGPFERLMARLKLELEDERAGEQKKPE